MGLSSSHGSHNSSYPLGRMFPLVSVGFLDAKGFTGIMTLQHTLKKTRMCVDYLTNLRSLRFALIQAWNLGISLGRSKSQPKAPWCYQYKILAIPYRL